MGPHRRAFLFFGRGHSAVKKRAAFLHAEASSCSPSAAPASTKYEIPAHRPAAAGPESVPPPEKQKSPAQHRLPGFTLIELLVVCALLTTVVGLALAVLMAARRQTSRACLAADSRVELLRIRKCLTEDLRQTRTASSDGQGLTLMGPGGSKVVWSAAGGSLRRTAGGQVRTFRLACQQVRADPRLDEGAGTVYFEVRLVLSQGKNILVAAARTRVGIKAAEAVP